MDTFSFKWKESFETGYEIIDLHHLELIKLINELAISYYIKKKKNTVEDVLFRLEEYFEHHFIEEESLLAELYDFPSEKHLQEHEDLIKEINDMKFEYIYMNKLNIPELIEFLKSWLTGHILGTDKIELKHKN